MSKKQKFIKVDPNSFERMINSIKSFEKENKAIKIKKMKLSRYLLEVSDYQNSTETISYQVKAAILDTHASSTDPATLNEATSMSTYGFTDPHDFNALTLRFNAIAKRHNPSAQKILRNEVKACAKVKDCIKLVSDVSYISPTKIQMK